MKEKSKALEASKSWRIQQPKPALQQMSRILSRQETQKKFIKMNPKNKVNDNGIILIDNYLKCK